MIEEKYTIHANTGRVLDCTCVVELTCDPEVIGLEFPQLAQENTNLIPMVYVCMKGTELTVRLINHDDIEHEFSWGENAGRWLQRDSPNQRTSAAR